MKQREGRWWGEELAERDPWGRETQGAEERGSREKAGWMRGEEWQRDLDSREDVQEGQRCPPRRPRGRERDRPEAPGKGNEEPEGATQEREIGGHRLIYVALSQRVSGKWLPLAGGQEATLMEAGQDGSWETGVQGPNALNHRAAPPWR